MSRQFMACVAQALLFAVFSLHADSAEDAAPAHAEDLETVVVTASPIGDPDRLAAIAGSVDRSQLLRSGAATLADGLSQVAGVTSSGYAAGAGRPVIRGMDANRVRVLENGIGSFDVSDIGPDHGVPVDPFSADRVEVVRGAATLRYGSQAIGGVVNAISERVPTRVPDEVFSGELTGGYGTGADSHDIAAQASARTGDVAWHADVFDRNADDYHTPDGAMVNSWVRGKGGALGGSWIGDDDRVGLGVIRYQSQYGIPGEESHIDMHQTKLLLRTSFGLDTGAFKKLTVDGGWADYAHSERDTSGSALSTFKDQEWDARAEAIAGRWGVLSESALGVQMQQRDFSALGEGREYLLPTTTQSRAVFGFTEVPLGERLRLQFGARVEDVSIEGTPGNDLATSLDFTPVSGAAGLVMDTGPWRFGLALSTAARAPAQTELFARGVHDATATYETGDPTLHTERADSAELSVRWRGDRVHADGSLWATRFEDYIHGVLTGRSCSEVGNCIAGDSQAFRELNYAQQDAQFRGAEAHAEVELLEHAAGDLHLNLLADTVRATLSDNGGPVPRIPPYHVGVGLAWQAAHFDANVFAKYSASQSRVAENETPTASYTSVDAQLAWRPWASRPDTELALVGRNLTDSVQRNAVSLNKEEVLLPGRDIRLMFRASFN